MTSLLLLLLTSVPHEGRELRESVDCIEQNHFYDDYGRHVFNQWIFWEWDGTRHQIVAWRLDRGERNFSELPPSLTWTDHENRRLRQVRAAYWRETWTQVDPELLEREILAKEKRRELRRK